MTSNNDVRSPNLNEISRGGVPEEASTGSNKQDKINVRTYISSTSRYSFDVGDVAFGIELGLAFTWDDVYIVNQ